MTKKTALNIIFLLLGLMLIYHFLIISQLIPFDQVWGGKLKSEAEMIQFESFSIVLVFLMLFIYALKYRHLNQGTNRRWVNIIIWIFAAFFLLNTLGNLMAESYLEMIVGSIFTLCLTILSVQVAR